MDHNKSTVIKEDPVQGKTVREKKSESLPLAKHAFLGRFVEDPPQEALGVSLGLPATPMNAILISPFSDFAHMVST